MTKTLMSLIQITAFLSSSAALAAVESKGPHEGLLLDSHITYSKDAGGRETDAKVILNGDSWTLVARTPQGNTLYGRTEKITQAAAGAGAATIGTNAASADASTGNSDATLGGDVSAPTKETAKFLASDNETIRVLYRELNEAGTEVAASAATAAVGSSATIELKDAHIESRVSKIRYQLE